MADILDEIVAHKRVEVEQMKALVPPADLYRQVELLCQSDAVVPSLREALMSASTGIIAEFKRKSPSKGWIKEEGRAGEIPLSYERSGAAAVSILTDEYYFGGSDAFITEARKSGLTIPVLYKNFVIDEYQLFQARLCGASAVLLIAADLTLETCASLLHTAHELGLEVLLETHDERELDYVALEPDVCGVNNRNLGTFITDVNNSFMMAERLPEDICKVSESGISNPQVIRDLKQAGFNGFLIGEMFMKTENPGASLRQLLTELQNEE